MARVYWAMVREFMFRRTSSYPSIREVGKEDVVAEHGQGHRR